jgi:hypothetical protein
LIRAGKATRQAAAGVIGANDDGSGAEAGSVLDGTERIHLDVGIAVARCRSIAREGALAQDDASVGRRILGRR